MTGALDLDTDGRDWPFRDASQFVLSNGLKWHVQVLGAPLGSAPIALLIHGTGASTHSWAALAPLLASDFTVVMPDLPGHAFTATPEEGQGLSLPGMATSLGALLRDMRIRPDIAVGHSAGAAVLMRATLDRAIEPRLLVSINGALLPLQGWAGQFFSPLAKLAVLNPFTPRIFAWRANDAGAVERVLRGTGSNIDATGVERYRRLFQNHVHIAGTLGMMARWDLEPLKRDMPKLDVPLLLIACGADLAISPETAFKVRELIPSAHVEFMRGSGHLVHEEQPADIARIIRAAAAQHKVLAA